MKAKNSPDISYQSFSKMQILQPQGNIYKHSVFVSVVCKSI